MFAGNHLFDAGVVCTLGPPQLPNEYTFYRHSGGDGLGGGATNGFLAIYFGPGTTIHTAFYCSNGDHAADNAFFGAAQAIVTDGYWTNPH